MRPSPEPEVVDHVVLGDLGQLEHRVHDLLRRRNEDDVRRSQLGAAPARRQARPRRPGSTNRQRARRAVMGLLGEERRALCRQTGSGAMRRVSGAKNTARARLSVAQEWRGLTTRANRVGEMRHGVGGDANLCGRSRPRNRCSPSGVAGGAGSPVGGGNSSRYVRRARPRWRPSPPSSAARGDRPAGTAGRTRPRCRSGSRPTALA